jgi:uncharacterized protein YkwD
VYLPYVEDEDHPFMKINRKRQSLYPVIIGYMIVLITSAILTDSFAERPLAAATLPGNTQTQKSKGKTAVNTCRTFLTEDEFHLYEMLMDYRQNNGQASVTISPSLTYVARMHARDLEKHPPKEPCSLHSWSKYGSWKPCCYRGNSSAACMWSKPSELTTYTGKGYEIVARSSGRMRPAAAYSSWIEESQHNAVILNTGNWKRFRWKSVGVGIYGSYAVVWFGEEPDPCNR